MQHEAIHNQQGFAEAVGAMSDMTARRPRIVVAGEFGSGKSSVINAMLRRPFIPFDIGASNRPLISVYNAEDTGIVVTPWNGAPYEVSRFEDIDRPDQVQGLAVRTPMPGLQGAEIIELPFHHDGVVEDGVISVMASADLLIWVTIASQAWRLTEKSVIERLPPECRARSVLAISRSDKLRSVDDWDKIESRIQRESGPFFSEVVFMQASNALLIGSGESDRDWSQTGGQSIVSIAQSILGPAAQQPREVPEHLYAEVLVVEPKETVVPFDRQAAAQPVEADEETEAATDEAGFDSALLRGSGIPGFMQSEREEGAAPVRRAETSSQHVRDAVMTGMGRRSMEDVSDEVEGILADTIGLDAAGIGNFRAAEIIKSFRSSANVSVDANVLASAICLNSAVGAAELLVPDDYIEEVMVSVGDYVFLIVPINHAAGTFAFFVVQSKRVNPAIMRVILRRVVALWGEVRAS